MNTESESQSSSANGVAPRRGERGERAHEDDADDTIGDFKATRGRMFEKLATLRRQTNEYEEALGLSVTPFAGGEVQNQAASAMADTARLRQLEPKRRRPRATKAEPPMVTPMPRRDARAVARAAAKAVASKKPTKKGARGPRPGSAVDKALTFLRAHPKTTSALLAKEFKITRVRAAGLYGQLRRLELAKSEGSHADMIWEAI